MITEEHELLLWSPAESPEEETSLRTVTDHDRMSFGKNKDCHVRFLGKGCFANILKAP